MRRRMHKGLCLLIGVALVVPALPAEAGRGRIVCESRNRNFNQCRVRTDNHVRLVRQGHQTRDHLVQRGPRWTIEGQDLGGQGTVGLAQDAERRVAEVDGGVAPRHPGRQSLDDEALVLHVGEPCGPGLEVTVERVDRFPEGDGPVE